MIFKKSLLLFFGFTCAFALVGQTKYLNQVKYWDYRYSFKKEFISIGTGNGKSLPATMQSTETQQLDYSNASVQLGWYIAMLATEYQILSANMYLPITEHEELSPTQNLIELYRALKTLDRLDGNAEGLFECDSLALNGFFIQNDNYFLDQDSLLIKNKRGSIEPDVDQYLNLFLGLAMVKQFIPEGTIVKGEDLNKLACTQASRMIIYLEKNDWRISHACNPSKTDIFSYGEYNMRKYSSELREVFSFFNDEGDSDLKIPFFRRKFWNAFKGKGNSIFEENRSILVQTLSNSAKNKTGKRLKKRALKEKWFIYPLLNAVLYPEQADFEKDSLINLSETMLNEVSSTEIVSSNQSDWNTSNYFFSNAEQRKSSQFREEQMKFNGLDFLLFYNIWFIHRTGL